LTDLLPLLQDFYRDKLTLLLRHEAGARLVSQYDFNNTYQYIINREEVHLSWIADAIDAMGGSVPDGIPEPDLGKPAKDIERRVFEEDAREMQAFVDRWRPRVDGMRNKRHAKMLQLTLGEALEHRRFFEQALAGRTDLLGRRAQQIGPAYGEVLPTRWIE
jgi:hypothetical protein